MINKKYKVHRKNVYVGLVVKADDIYRCSELKINNYFSGLSVSGYYPCRSMLFVPDENRLANDLLYNSPAYPILNVTDDKFCLAFDNKGIVIKDACNLDKLLTSFGYNEEITFSDIKKIRKIFFTGKFAADNSELFGWKEIMPKDWTYYENDIKITNPRIIRQQRNKERMARLMGHRSFNYNADSILPREYFDVLDELGDNSLLDIINVFEDKINAFKPSKKEKYVKKLTKF